MIPCASAFIDPDDAHERIINVREKREPMSKNVVVGSLTVFLGLANKKYSLKCEKNEN